MFALVHSPPVEGWQAKPDGVVFSYPTNLRQLVGADLYDALLKIKSFYAFFISFFISSSESLFKPQCRNHNLGQTAFDV